MKCQFVPRIGNGSILCPSTDRNLMKRNMTDEKLNNELENEVKETPETHVETEHKDEHKKTHRKSKKEEQCEKLEAELLEIKDKHLRLQAEYR
jgi:molecular chaperone GrpE